MKTLVCRPYVDEAENKVVVELIAKGYVVDIVNWKAKTFSEKYKVYQKTSIGNKLVIVDNDGNEVGVQG